jgi:hypothetical protein
MDEDKIIELFGARSRRVYWDYDEYVEYMAHQHQPSGYDNWSRLCQYCLWDREKEDFLCTACGQWTLGMEATKRREKRWSPLRAAWVAACVPP